MSEVRLEGESLSFLRREKRRSGLLLEEVEVVGGEVVVVRTGELGPDASRSGAAEVGGVALIS